MDAESGRASGQVSALWQSRLRTSVSSVSTVLLSSVGPTGREGASHHLQSACSRRMVLLAHTHTGTRMHVHMNTRAQRAQTHAHVSVQPSVGVSVGMMDAESGSASAQLRISPLLVLVYCRR